MVGEQLVNAVRHGLWLVMGLADAVSLVSTACGKARAEAAGNKDRYDDCSQFDIDPKHGYYCFCGVGCVCVVVV